MSEEVEYLNLVHDLTDDIANELHKKNNQAGVHVYKKANTFISFLGYQINANNGIQMQIDLNAVI